MNWQLTMTLLWCEKVHSWVPVSVYEDGTVRCGHLTRLERSKKKIGKSAASCSPASCELCISYKQKVFSREGKV